MRICKAPDIDTISRLLANELHKELKLAIESRGQASIALSGGTSPALTMRLLSQKKLDWSKVVITLSDERWLPEDNPRSNHLLLKNNMLINQASVARFVPLYLPEICPVQGVEHLQKRLEPLLTSFDICLLGMGTDGHFASLFPDSPQLQEGLSSSKSLIVADSLSVPETRISMTLDFISKARKVYLLIAGPEKHQILRNAMKYKTARNLPVASLISRVEINIFESEK